MNRHIIGHSLVLGTVALAPAPLMARFLNLPGPSCSHLRSRDNLNKAVVRTTVAGMEQALNKCYYYHH